MAHMKMAILLLTVLAIGATARQLKDGSTENAMEHQRILAELEEVHQLRERMLQEAATYSSTSGAPAPGPSSTSGSSSPAVSDVSGGTSSGVNEGSTASSKN